MRVFIDCDCEIMQKTLEIFLKNFTTPNLENADFIVSDEAKSSEKPLFIIGKNGDLKLPFSKEQLLSNLENFEKSALVQASNENFASDSLEEQIGAVFDEFKEKILQILRQNNG